MSPIHLLEKYPDAYTGDKANLLKWVDNLIDYKCFFRSVILDKDYYRPINNQLLLIKMVGIIRTSGNLLKYCLFIHHVMFSLSVISSEQ